MRTSNRPTLIPLLAATVLGVTCPAHAKGPTSGPTSRPADPWVFRSVLDKHPRMVTVALHENLWLAFDAQSCTWRKAWKGGVKFTGSVYDTKHGPQPQSMGKAYFEGGEPPCTLVKNDRTVEARPIYRGYVIHEGRLTLKYDLQADGSTIAVEEMPEYTAAEHSFVRKVRVRGLRDGEKLYVPISYLRSPAVKDIRFWSDAQTGFTLPENKLDVKLSFGQDGEVVAQVFLQGEQQ